MSKEILRTNNTYKLHGEYTGFTEFTKSTDGEFTDWIKYVRTNQTDRIYGSHEYDLTLDRI